MSRARRYRSGTRWCLWRWTDVEVDGRLYLRRLHLVATPWCSLMLHWIVRPDPQPDLHDHPVSFLSFVLRGGYDEDVPDPAGTRRVRWVNRKTATDLHRIVAGRAVTLVLAGPVVRDWGFATPQGWVPWRDYSAASTSSQSSR